MKINISILALACILSMGTMGFSQDNSELPKNEIQVTAGWAGFHDDDWTHNAVGGVTYQRRMSPHFLMGTEVAFVSNSDPRDRREIATNTLFIFELGSSRTVRPYVLAGGGMRNERQRTEAGSNWIRHGTAGGGFGIKLAMGSRFYVAPEMRFGVNPAARTTVSIGYRL